MLGGLVGGNASGDVSLNTVTIKANNSGRVDISNYVAGGVNQGIGDAGNNSVSISSSDTSEVNIQSMFLAGLLMPVAAGVYIGIQLILAAAAKLQVMLPEVLTKGLERRLLVRILLI